jgi:hypothetical protein
MLPPTNNKTKKMNLKDEFGHINWLSKYGRGFNVFLLKAWFNAW